MPSGSFVASLLWFIAIVALIPLALWLLKRSPMGSGTGQGPMRCVGVLPLAQHQRLVTVEVGRGEARRWLVLGVTAQSIQTLHEMAPQDDAAAPPPPAASFSALLARLQHRPKGSDAR